MTRIRVDLSLRVWAPLLSLSIFCVSAFFVPLCSLDSWAAKALGIKKLGAGASRREAHPGAVWLPEEGGEGAEFSALPFLSFAQEGWTLLWRDEI